MRILRFLAALGMTAALTLPAYANHLANATSPYLRQHAKNPVDWYPWGDAALARAKKENKPIFLSIGYSSCHWCHVMEAESFSQPDVAAVLNRHYVSIKVDREERPDVDAAYTAAALKLLDEAGWPLNLMLTPDGKPFFAATYLPKERLIEVAGKLATAWREQPDRVAASAAMIVAQLRPAASEDAETLGRQDLDAAYRELASQFDPTNGGFGGAPKFPSPQNLFFLLRYWKRTGEPRALAMVETTLHAMRNSALFDAKAFGFHRYATDAAWQKPHFEKMLYDQALLALAYAEAYQATRKAEYADTARKVFAYVLRDLRAPNGAFYSSKDADSDARDDKILADWNGLMIAALAAGATALDEPAYAEAAARAAKAIPNVRPYLDDYAFFIWGLLNLYEASADARWLKAAIRLQDQSLKLFKGGTMTASDDLFVRLRIVRDSATPAGTAVQLANLLRLSRMTARDDYAAAAQSLMRSATAEVRAAPSAAPHFLSAVDFALGPSFEIVLAGKDVAPLKRAVFAAFVPNKVVLYRTPEIVRLAPFTKMQVARGGKPTAYVCRNYVCNLPTGDAGRVTELLSVAAPAPGAGGRERPPLH
jgi:uncharacterized protein YyaL (SSP411 family)